MTPDPLPRVRRVVTAVDADGRSYIADAGPSPAGFALPGSPFCGLPKHQALSRFTTAAVAILEPLSDEEIADLSDPDKTWDDVVDIVTRAEELFGDGFNEEYAREAEERWGDTDAYRQSQERTARYTAEDWAEWCGTIGYEIVTRIGARVPRVYRGVAAEGG